MFFEIRYKILRHPINYPKLPIPKLWYILDVVSFTNSGLLVMYMYYFICVKLLLFFDYILLLFFWWRFLTRKGIIKYADWPTSTIIKKADLLKMTHFNWIHIIWLPGAQGKSEKWNRFNIILKYFSVLGD